jgi:DNA-binding LacI/PurR family transcriptional regulator
MIEKVTVRKIASRCGVSAATVSRVLSGSAYPVRSSLREQVLRTAKELGYGAETDAGRQIDEIAILVPTTANPFYASLIDGIERILVKENYNTCIYNALTGSPHGDSARIMKHLVSKNVRGVVIAAFNDDAVLEQEAEELQSHCIKVVMVDSPKPDFRFNCVSYDYEKASYLGTEYLINWGHRRIIYAGLEVERESRRLRIVGFQNAMRAHQLPVQNGGILIREAESEETDQIMSGEKMCDLILSMKPRPTAIAAINDLVALGLLRGFHKYSVAVPGEISILGFDDSPYSEMTNPPLSTIQVQSEQMGSMAAMLLLQDVKGISETPANLYLKPQIIERGTVAPPPKLNGK